MNPRLLAIDTTSDFGSLALLEGPILVEELVLHSPDGFAHILFDQLQALLARHQWTLESLDCLAAASGPGSFTGVRVGLTAAKGLAEVLGKPVVAVSNLRAIASFGASPLRAALLDARRGDIYGGLYDASGTLVEPEVVMRFPDWMAHLAAREVEFVSPHLAMFAPLLPESRSTECPRHLAAAVGRIALLRLLSGRTQDPLTVDANYVRRSDAELFWKEA